MNTCFAPIGGRVMMLLSSDTLEQAAWQDFDALNESKCVIFPGSGSALWRLSGVLGEVAETAEHSGNDRGVSEKSFLTQLFLFGLSSSVSFFLFFEIFKSPAG